MTQRERQILRWIEENPLISQQELADKAGITRSSAAVHISNLMKKGYITGKGYIVSNAAYAVVVGGVNVDIGGIPYKKLVRADSNPGQVRMSLGGVGRNIAHNMALMGVDTRMITALGDDLNARKITASCAELGIDISKSLRVSGAATSSYLFIANEDGDMELALSDMDIYDHLTPAFLSTRQPMLNNAQLIVLDANISAEAIAWIAGHVEPPIFADPTSTAKAEKLKPVLGRIHTLKPNRIEAQLLSGVQIVDEASLNRAADKLLETGLHRVFISLGADGVLAADQNRRIRLPGPKTRLVNATGGGDAFMAALVWAYLQGTDLENSAKAGLAAASIAAEGRDTINPELSEAAVKARMNLA